MIRSYRPEDRSAVLAINQMNVPDVGDMDDHKLDFLLEAADQFLVVEVDGEVVGIMILLGPGGTYPSPNYRWFSERYDDFLYVDRIALVPEARGQGWGPALYTWFAERAAELGAPVLTAEVNTVPRNDRSLRFHEINGFEEAGRCQPYGGDEEVAMLVKTLT